MYNLPQGVTEKELLKIIDEIANQFCNKLKFTYYEAEDIKQECYIIAATCLDRYDGKRPLRNFLFIHIRNRLFNLKRDKFCRSILVDNPRKLVQMPIDICSVDDET